MTAHEVRYRDASDLEEVPDSSIALVVTSPPYPMIKMWDEFFFRRNPAIKEAVDESRFSEAFELMHAELDKVWRELFRVLLPGGIACINIGDAVRTLNSDFRLFSSHSRILRSCLDLGFRNLPNIIWRKTTNAPNKFMGSGMLPPGAYVTLEHEYVLVFRKGSKREFKTPEEKRNRRESAFFWEERNVWFSDVWFGLTGVGQNLDHPDLRRRSAAFPFEFAYRLVNMFSVKYDTVLDPFLGTGTTMLAAMASERNSIGYEIDESFRVIIDSQALGVVPFANAYIRKRLAAHTAFVKKRSKQGKSVRNVNVNYRFPCVSAQEKHILLRDLEKVGRKKPSLFIVDYAASAQEEFVRDGAEFFEPELSS